MATKYCRVLLGSQTPAPTQGRGSLYCVYCSCSLGFLVHGLTINGFVNLRGLFIFCVILACSPSPFLDLRTVKFQDIVAPLLCFKEDIRRTESGTRASTQAAVELVLVLSAPHALRMERICQYMSAAAEVGCSLITAFVCGMRVTAQVLTLQIHAWFRDLAYILLTLEFEIKILPRNS